MAPETGSAQLPQGEASRFGLGGDIVVIVEDRGEQHYRNDFGALSADSAQKPREPVSLKQLPDALARIMPEGLNESVAYFPRKELDEIMSLSQITKIMPELECFDDQDKAEQADMICFGINGKPPCRKLLAALVGIQCARLIKCAMDDGMRDDCLPLWFEPRDQAFFLKCQNQDHVHSKLNQALSDATTPLLRNALKQSTHSLTAPYLKQLPDKHFHYVLDHGDKLPMETLQVLENLNTNDEDKNAGYVALGGFGKVYKVQINPSHYNFVSAADSRSGDTVSKTPQKCFALKKLNDNKLEVFEEELKSLLFCLHHKFVDEQLLEEGQKHMSHVRASFEIRNKTNSTTEYFFLFDWQDGNLSEFWRNEDKRRNDENHPRCMAQQIFGLAAALQCVHNDRTARQCSPRAQNYYSVYGRHGDLGPSNILYSITERGELELKLADFGLTQLHSRSSRTFDNKKPTHRTETYRGPEFDIKDGMISRATDIFSFGCVILEYITWYLLGNDAVKGFSDTRFKPEPHRPGFATDTYFSIPSKLSTIDDAVLKPQVFEHIENLNKNPRCSWYLHQMLELVVQMLNPNPQKRIQSSRLTKDLHAFRETCNVDQSYYTGYWKSVSRKPSWDLHYTA